MLEQQLCGINAAALRVLPLPAGFHYTWRPAGAGSASCAGADAVDPASISLNGVALDLGATYRVTVNTFLADGGDGFGILPSGTDRFGGPVDTDAFEAYLRAAEPAGVSPPPLTRIDLG